MTEPSRVGGVTGLVGAAGGLGGFVPPLIMGYVYGRTDSYAIGLWLLSVTAALHPGPDPDRRPSHRRAQRRARDQSLGDAIDPVPTQTTRQVQPGTDGRELGLDGAASRCRRRFFTKGRSPRTCAR